MADGFSANGGLHVLLDRLVPAKVRTGTWRHDGRNGSWVHRTLRRAYQELLCFPDDAWPWLLRYPGTRDRVAGVRPHVIFSSSPPGTSHVIAGRLSRDLGVPWVADFRNPWSHCYTIDRSRVFRAAE